MQFKSQTAFKWYLSVVLKAIDEDFHIPTEKSHLSHLWTEYQFHHWPLGGSLRAAWLFTVTMDEEVSKEGRLFDAKYWEILFPALDPWEGWCLMSSCLLSFWRQRSWFFHLLAHCTIIFLLDHSPEKTSIHSNKSSPSTRHFIETMPRVHWHQILWKALTVSVAVVLFKWVHIWVIV